MLSQICPHVSNLQNNNLPVSTYCAYKQQHLYISVYHKIILTHFLTFLLQYVLPIYVVNKDVFDNSCQRGRCV